MVSIIERKNQGFGDFIYKFAGKSTDIKPKASNASTFKEMDTGNEYYFDGDEKDWVKQAERYLTSIEIETAPTKLEYYVGDELDLTGIVVRANYTDNTDKTLIDTDYSVDIDRPLKLTDTQFTVSYKENGHTRTAIQPIVVQTIPVVLSSIAITTAPTKTVYYEGDALDLSGIVVTATYSDGSEVNVTEDCTFSPVNGATLSTENTDVTVSFTDDEVTKTADVAITVATVVLESIAFTATPQLDYGVGDTLDLTGTEITATYDNDSIRVVTEDCSFTPADGSTLTAENTRLTATYTEGGVTKTSWKTLTVGG